MYIVRRTTRTVYLFTVSIRFVEDTNRIVSRTDNFNGRTSSLLDYRRQSSDNARRPEIRTSLHKSYFIEEIHEVFN